MAILCRLFLGWLVLEVVEEEVVVEEEEEREADDDDDDDDDDDAEGNSHVSRFNQTQSVLPVEN